ncbi:MAG TPA: M20/M25/M40 family metallo-hydrolase [Bryobacteraceae bacterium]|jgi:acetylornithine deacetylase/succinyl-diaminopimelate desuccinylase-like protein
MFWRALAAAAFLVLNLPAQDPVAAARQWRLTHQAEILSGFASLLRIPNLAADAADLHRNASTLVELLTKRHVTARLLSIPGAPPVVFGERKVAAPTHTIVFYAHYDGQPVTVSEWQNPPFSPLFRTVDGEERIFARSASDDKAAIYAQLMALDALDAAHIPLRSTIRFVWEGEEESGSPHLEEILNANHELVQGDIWLVCDGPVDQSRTQTVVFGARGDAHLEITVFGPYRPIHSGHYGNWAPNPAMMLAQLLAGMKDDQGHVRIANFYDGVQPLGELEKQALARAPANDRQLRQELALGRVDGGGARLLELLNLPSLEIRGMSSAQTGTHATNVIPSTAVADLDLRLVVGLDWRQQQQRVIEYIRSQGYFVVDKQPARDILIAHPKVAMVTKDAFGYNAVRTPMDLPIVAEVVAAVKAARGSVIEWPTMGGSLPLGAIERAARTRTITVPIANHDNNQHAANENLRLQNLWDGMETMASLLCLQ